MTEVRKLTRDQIARAGQLMSESIRHNILIERFPVELRPQDAADGKLIAEEALRILDWPVVGWKIGYGAPAERATMPNVPVPGRLLEGWVVSSPAQVDRKDFHDPLIEAELAIRLGSDLPARADGYTLEEVAAAVESIHVGIEVADKRFESYKGLENAEKHACNAFARLLVVGGEVPNWRDASLAEIEVEMLLDGKPVSEGRVGEDRCDGIWSLWWLINDVGSRGYSMKAGQVISSGAIAKVFPLGEASEAIIRFNGAEARIVFAS